MAATVNELFFSSIESRPRDHAMLRRRGDAVESLSTEDVALRVRRFALAIGHLGVRPGDRVAILSYNRPEWAIADYGILTAGAAGVPIYTTLPTDEIGFILRDAGARAIVVEDAAQAAKIAAVRATLPELRHVIGLHRGGDGIMSWEEVQQRGIVGTQQDHRRVADAVKPGDLATIIYTSGTTGVPKGVMLTHGNLAANSRATIGQLGLGPEYSTVSFLPLSHVFQRQIDLSLFAVGAPIAYATSIPEVAADLPVFRPRIMGVVPRFLEKMHQAIMAKLPPKLAGSVTLAREALRRRLAGDPVPVGMRLRRWFYDRLVFRKIRAKLGGEMRYLVSGGAPLAPELAEFFTAIGVTVLQGYGLTETSPVIAVNEPSANRIGTVGRVIPDHELRIAEDGEILFRGPSVMKGYFNRPDATDEVLKDGWFHTGDIGELDADGYLRITDRKKDLFKTSGGKYIAPQPLEKQLKDDPAVLNAVVVGANRKFASVLIVPDLERLAADGVGGDDISKRFQSLLERINATLPGYSTLKKFALLERDFTIESGEMTPTFKVKRRVVEERYREVIDRLYAGPS